MKVKIARSLLFMGLLSVSVFSQTSFYWFPDAKASRVDFETKGDAPGEPLLSDATTKLQVPEGAIKWSVTKEFTLIRQDVSGDDFEVVLNVMPQKGAEEWVPGGIMFSAGDKAGASDIYCIIAVTRKNSVVFNYIQNNPSDSAAITHIIKTSDQQTLPLKLKLEKNGAKLIGRYKPNNALEWTKLKGVEMEADVPTFQVSHMLFEPAIPREQTAKPVNPDKLAKKDWVVQESFIKVPKNEEGNVFAFTLNAKPRHETKWKKGGFVISTHKNPLKAEHVWTLSVTSDNRVVFDVASVKDETVPSTEALTLPIALKVKSDGEKLKALYQPSGSTDWTTLAKVTLPEGAADIYVSQMLFEPLALSTTK